MVTYIIVWRVNVPKTGHKDEEKGAMRCHVWSKAAHYNGSSPNKPDICVYTSGQIIEIINPPTKPPMICNAPRLKIIAKLLCTKLIPIWRCLYLLKTITFSIYLSFGQFICDLRKSFLFIGKILVKNIIFVYKKMFQK